ncbi:MAG TPA: DNA translocase FtsK 4TM domain-containing protein [Candidatus Paceibacterota bacterium]|nr:DNA translocase FtsK 4TM domain-containing protein [Candidatus Pacearchaeota archaeon]HQD89184.1 DNA translocase FtsK 4TM domain-containing protein [Candidatus Pacearchaeota archaeon]HRR39168.1 DNA translocase FtsK 4TM domain-containing protein [Candidatus Paceibacterota bacterium]
MKKKKKNKNQPQLRKKNSQSRFFNLSPEAKKSIWGVIFAFVGIFFVFSLLGIGGEAGNSLSKVLYLFFGNGAWLIAIIFFAIGIIFFLSERPSPYPSTISGGILFFIAIFSLLELCSEDAGGFLGKTLISLPQKYFGVPGSFAFFIALLLISISLLFNISVFKKVKIFSSKQKKEEKDLSFEELKKLQEGKAKIKVKEILPQKISKEKIEKTEEPIIKKVKKVDYKTLPLALLDREENNAIAGNIRSNAQIIKRTFHNFGIDVEMGEVSIGPSVTQYTLKPAEGIKLSRILSLQNDLALALAAHPIRIEAPIPGRSLVGIEVPNQKRAQVRLANLLSSPEFLFLPPLGIALGKDVMGKPYFGDIGSMPHLLVAGATGSGKTVFLNSLILSLLWRNGPQDLRLALVDPKRVEFSPYSSLPHLLCDPITQHQKIIPLLKWLTKEMEDRFSILQNAKKRDIKSYNEFVEIQIAKGNEEFEKLPYIVLIIDELADIMSSKGKEFEAVIVRLAQMSRAVGIHLVLATQRPSVEVLTGLIKANITSRVAFKVASQIDSRTILDMAGAERLLGQGDMLYLSGEAAKPKRLQSAFVSSEEIRRVVDFVIKHQQEEKTQKLTESLEETLNNETVESDLFQGGPGGDDELYEEAKRVVMEAGKASASLLQRRLKIGYARAARLLDMLEENGIIGPSQGAKPRDVYLKEDSKENNNSEEEDLNFPN